MDENNTKALDLLVESLKLYVTISTVAIAGLLAYWSGGKSSSQFSLLAVALAAFLLCAVASVWNINHFVAKIYDDKADIYGKEPRVINSIAIGAFVVGLIFAALFLALKDSASPGPSTGASRANAVEIRGNSVTIGEDVRTKIKIKKNTQGQVESISIN